MIGRKTQKQQTDTSKDMAANTIKGQPVVDESEAATAGTVTTSTTKHDVAVNILVDEDGPEDHGSNQNDPPHDSSVNEKLEAMFAGATPVADSEKPADPSAALPVTAVLKAGKPQDERRAKLQECEMTIKKGLATFVEVGAALAYIHINKLYLLEHKTWEEYLERRWGFTRQRAFQYMEAAEGHQKLSTQIAGQRKLPESERAMRELLKAPTDKVIDILDELGDKEELTAERIVKVRQKLVPKKTSAKAKKKPVIKFESALKAAGVWTAYLAACDLESLTEQQRKDLKKANKTAADKFKEVIAA